MRKLIDHYLCHTPRCFRFKTHGDYCALCFIARNLKPQAPAAPSSADVSNADIEKSASGGIFIPDITTDSRGQAVEAEVTRAKSGNVTNAVDALRALKKKG